MGFSLFLSLSLINAITPIYNRSNTHTVSVYVNIVVCVIVLACKWACECVSSLAFNIFFFFFALFRGPVNPEYILRDMI